MIRNFINKLSIILLTIGGLEWGYMLVVSFIDSNNYGDLDDFLIYSDFDWMVWLLRILHFLIVLSAVYILYPMMHPMIVKLYRKLRKKDVGVQYDQNIPS